MPPNAVQGRSSTSPTHLGCRFRLNTDPVCVRDLPLAGRVTHLVWRKRRYRRQDCGSSFTEQHEQLASRQRVSARFRQRLLERLSDGAAHAEVARDERTTRYQVARAFGDRPWEVTATARHVSLDEAHHRRGGELATVVSDLDRRCMIEVLDGCQRRVIECWLQALPAEVRAGIEVVSIDPSEGYRQAPGVVRCAEPAERGGRGWPLRLEHRKLPLPRRRGSARRRDSSARPDVRLGRGIGP